MNIRTVDADEVVEPTKNEKARETYNMGTNLLNENKLDEAEKYLKESIDLDPIFVDAMDHLGIVYRRKNNLRKAEEIYLKSMEINKENKVPYMNLAVIYIQQNRLNDAFELYKILIQIDKDDPEPYYGIGDLFYEIGNYENSMPFLDKAIELYINQKSPYVYDAFCLKGKIYYKIGGYDEALKYFEQVEKGIKDDKMIENINKIKMEIYKSKTNGT
jgi:tetratricopeptide (TPR) repeat protein